MDLHEDIHRAIESYVDPNEFRRWLNSAIQNSRGVTFLLQKRKAQWPDFDSWYGEWQADAKSNPVLSWGVTARNRVVKEEDLKTLSTARISVYGKYGGSLEDVFVVPPEATVEMIIDSFAYVAAKKPAQRKGMILVQRKWVDDQLPDHELVSALREMYAAVAAIVSRAHKASGVSQCDIEPFTRECITAAIHPELPCLPPGDPMPNRLFDLETGETARFEYVKVERDDDLIEIGKKRYGLPPKFTKDPISHAMERLELSKQFLETDGYAGPILLLYRGNESRMHAVVFPDSDPKELVIAAAVEAEGAWPFDAALFSSETWLSAPGGRGSLLGVPSEKLLDSNDDFFNAGAGGDRDEALCVVVITADKRSRVLMLPFGRTTEGIVYGKLIDDDSGRLVPSFLYPVWRRWQS